MDLKTNLEGDRARFEIKGAIDAQGAEDLKTRFRSLNLSALKEVILDFKDVNHIGSAGIGKLLLFYKGLAVSGGVLRVVNLSDSIDQLFRSLKLDSVLHLER